MNPPISGSDAIYFYSVDYPLIRQRCVVADENAIYVSSLHATHGVPMTLNDIPILCAAAHNTYTNLNVCEQQKRKISLRHRTRL